MKMIRLFLCGCILSMVASVTSANIINVDAQMGSGGWGGDSTTKNYFYDEDNDLTYVDINEFYNQSYDTVAAQMGDGWNIAIDTQITALQTSMEDHNYAYLASSIGDYYVDDWGYSVISGNYFRDPLNGQFGVTAFGIYHKTTGILNTRTQPQLGAWVVKDGDLWGVGGGNAVPVPSTILLFGLGLLGLAGVNRRKK